VDGAGQIGASRRKNLAIVSEAAKRAELLDALATKAAEVERLYNSQRKLNEKTDTIIGSKLNKHEIPSFFAITLSMATLSAFCGTPPSSQTQTAAYENSVEQARLREKAARLKIEMLQLLNDFRQYPGTASDISQAEAAAENLGALSEKDMLSVIETLRDASRTNAADTDNRLVKASNGQKAIQSALRSVADRLAAAKRLCGDAVARPQFISPAAC